MMMGKQVRETRQNSPQTTTSGQFDPRPFTAPEPEHEAPGREGRFGHSFSEIDLFPIQPKLRLGTAGDRYEQEADQVADQVMRMPNGGAFRRKCAKCGEEEKKVLQTIEFPRQVSATHRQDVPDSVQEILRSPGQPLDHATRAYMEPRFGEDFSRVRVHTDAKAAESAQDVKARAYTAGQDVVFGEKQYAPRTREGRWLLAHEFAHVIQQNSCNTRINLIQCALSSPRLAGNPLFENVSDNRAVIGIGDRGPEVRRIQQLLIDLGFRLPVSGANGNFATETENAVKAFQRREGLNDDGRVEATTINALDRAFPAFTLPAQRTAPWSMSCVLSILCPWNRHLVENVLPRFNIITFNSRTFPVETWNGSMWVRSIFHSGGFRSGTDMGFLNSTTCQQFALTVYHEGWHAQQPRGLTGVVDVERDAYINAEQWSIAAGIPGVTFSDTTRNPPRREDLRTRRSGETVVDEPATERLVRQKYGGVSSIPGERILRRIGASDVRVRRANGSEYTRAANPGESVRGAIPTMPGQRRINPADWNCP